MLRFEVGELPAIDVADAVVTIGSGPHARIRLPASEAREVHVRIEHGAWVNGEARGVVGEETVFAIGSYRVRVTPSPPGATATAPQSTETLARELVRGLLGTDGSPTLTIERGANAGAKRFLAPPESVLVIGRGDEAGWSIPDDDLSRTHAEIRRGLDGTTIRDLDSKNGTRVAGKRVRTAQLRDGQLIELGDLAFRFRDPVAPAPVVAAREVRAARPAFWLASALCAVAVAGLIWVLLG